MLSPVDSVAQFAEPAPAEGYFPDGRVANESLWLSPVSGADMYGVPVDVAFQTGAYPEIDDGRQDSWDQGLGRSPGQQWPHMPIREQFSFESTTNMSGIMEDGTADLPADSDANPTLGKAERQGWAMLGPALSGQFYQQDIAEHYWWDEPIVTEVAPSQPLQAISEVPW